MQPPLHYQRLIAEILISVQDRRGFGRPFKRPSLSLSLSLSLSSSLSLKILPRERQKQRLALGKQMLVPLAVNGVFAGAVCTRRTTFSDAVGVWGGW